MEKKYDFKRSFYYDVEDAVKNSSVTFLLGARRCGKTVCMRQVSEYFNAEASGGIFDKAVYTDMKKDFEDIYGKMDFINHVADSIRKNEKILYLIDEATYMQFPDREIMKIQDAFTLRQNDNTKVVFSGSQSKALEYWGHLAFAGDAAYIRTGFLSYPEWLAYKGLTDISEETYSSFLFGTREFYRNFHSTKEYLQGCLDETVISNNKAGEIIYGNDCSGLNDEMLLDVLYASLFSLHNHVAIREKASDLLSARYQNFKRMDGEDLLQSLRFLNNCGLITVTHVTDDLECSPYYCRQILSALPDGRKQLSKQEIMERLNVCIKYPMFYMDIVKELSGEQMPDVIPPSLLGSIVECHVRGLLPDTGCLEYRDAGGREVDYVNTSFRKGIEISVSNKKTSRTNFGVLPDEYGKILLTKDRQGIQDGVEQIPYYRFIYEHSVGKDIHRGMTQNHSSLDDMEEQPLDEHDS